MPFSSETLHRPALSPAITIPGTENWRGIAQYPPEGIVFAPQATRLPPSRIFLTNGCVLNSWRTSWTEKVASV